MPPVPSLSSLRNRQPQQSETRAAQPSSGYRSDYDQYSQYHQQQMYPGYYSSWGYDQTGYAYNGQLYDYSQYPAAQVSPRRTLDRHVLRPPSDTVLFSGERAPS